MNFEQLKFQYPWRPYQQRVINAIERHLDDDRLHVVAAPGAGKTTLGLEVFRRLEKNALVLSPTRIIRDQWILRLDDFIETSDVTKLEWVSNNIDDLKVLTSIPYQAMHSKLSRELSAELDDGRAVLDDSLGEAPFSEASSGDINEFIVSLKNHNIEVIIMDEAHHLRAEWWRALDKIFESLPNLTLVSLTATPPYDSQGHEWNKYEQLCGPIDEEISVPELVKAGTLCSHQDFVWAVNVSQSEKKHIKEYDERVSTLCNTLFNDSQFQQLVLAHPWLTDAVVDSDVIKQPRIAIAILSFAKAKKLNIPLSLSSLLDLTENDIPELGRRWWQVLIESVLFSNTFEHTAKSQEFIAQLKKQLRSSELLHKRELSLERSRRLERSLSLSATKAEGCVSIHKLEYKHRKDDLCQVILTDYIRDEALTSGIDTGELNLGAWPVFRGIVANSEIPNQTAMLSGRLSIIHRDQLDRLLSLVDTKRVSAEAFQGDDVFFKISGPLNQLTSAFTTLLMQGNIKVLVGTRSLLGEGWDAPAINSLILASSVGSFMLTNQMRGRAIRIDKKNPDKISSIWHLVAIDTESPSGHRDYYELKNRFETFVGLSEKEQTIESGFDRLETSGLNKLKSVGSEKNAVLANNQQMTRRFEKRDVIADRWTKALTLNETARVIPSVRTPTIPGVRRFHFKNTLKYLTLQLTVLFGLVTLIALQLMKKPEIAITVLIVGLVSVLLYKLPKTINIVKTFFCHLPIDGSIKQIGIALCNTLCQTGLIETSIRRIKVTANENMDGTFYLSLSGSTFYESSLFADCLAEILAPIDSPRYLVIREGEVYGLKRDDYHAVPLKLGVKKEYAQIFYKAWCRYVGPTEMIYTRTNFGRQRLLQAKMRAFSSVFEQQIKRQDRWQ
jgi:superfamily II DNA or RNA helicase